MTRNLLMILSNYQHIMDLRLLHVILDQEMKLCGVYDYVEFFEFLIDLIDEFLKKPHIIFYFVSFLVIQ